MESSSAPSKIQIITWQCLKMCVWISGHNIPCKIMYEIHVLFCSYSTEVIPNFKLINGCCITDEHLGTNVGKTSQSAKLPHSFKCFINVFKSLMYIL